MAKFSTFKYGDGTKYGAGDQPANLHWGFIVAWDGYYGWGNDASRMVGLSVRRGRQSMFKGKGFRQFPPGEATVILDNSDGRFDPFNEDSPLYPNVTPGKFCRLSVYDAVGDASYEIMRGTIANIIPLKQGETQRVRIQIVDGLQWLENRFIEVSVVKDDAKYTLAEQIINDVGVDWPTAQSEENGEWPWQIADSTPAAQGVQDFWWAWRQSARDAFDELNEAEVAVLFHSRDGKITWLPRDYAHIRSQAVTQDQILRDVAREHPWESMRNNVRAQVYTKIKNEDAPSAPTLWTLQEVLPIAVGESLRFHALFKYEEWRPATDNPGVVFTANTQADGGGDDITGSIAQSRGGDEGEVSEGIVVVLRNESTSDGYITSCYVTGRPIYTPDENGVTVKDKLSVMTYGPRTLDLDSRWAESYEQQEHIVNWLLWELKEPCQIPTIQIEDRPSLQFYPDLCDRVELDIDYLSLDDSYRVGHIEHRWLTENGQSVLTTFKLEPYLIEGDEYMAYKGARVYRVSTSQEIASAASTEVTFNAETHDRVNYHSLTSNTGRITIPSGMSGYYRIYAQIKWEADAGATGLRILYVKKNGGATAIAERVDDATNLNMVQLVVDAQLLNAGDYVTIEAYQSSGGALDVQHGTGNTFLGVDFLGVA